MEVFQLILCIIGVVVFSSFASRFIPKVSTPLVQIAMGAIITQVPGLPNASLNPELFMVLFIAPLLYLEAHEIDKSELLKSLKLSLSLAIGLAIATMVAVGVVVHAVWPSGRSPPRWRLARRWGRPTRWRSALWARRRR